MYSVGDRVRHRSRPAWGVGEVTGVRPDGKLSIFFEHGGPEKLLANPDLELVTGDDKTRPIRPTRSGIGQRSKSSHGLTLEQYKLEFVRRFPAGFTDEEFIRQERDYKLAASRALADRLSQSEVRELIAAGDYEEICRRARSIINKTNLIYPQERMALDDGLKKESGSKRFAEAFQALLYGTGEYRPRFERFCTVLEDIGAAKWTTATYFSFLAWPDTHIFIKPTPTKKMANACAIELNYRPQLNWLTYECALKVAEILRSELASLQPSDMLDIQSFIWKVAR